MIHSLVEQGQAQDKAYELREQKREQTERKHQLEMMALLMGKPAA